jgi:hypothetical protein
MGASGGIRLIMGIWRRAFRPQCLGLFVDKGVLYARRDEHLTPIAIPLQGARIFLDIEVGSRRPLDVPEGATIYRPAAPPTKGGKLYTISVHSASNEVYIGYPANGGEARNIFRATEKLVQSAQLGSLRPGDHNLPASRSRYDRPSGS